jgi:hypothetical protein
MARDMTREESRKRIEEWAATFPGEPGSSARIIELERALRDCMSYVDCDNLTMQTKHRNWAAVLNGRKFNPANCETQ